MKKILAVIVSYNPDESIMRLYNSIKEQVDELIIIDNFTTDQKSKKYLKFLSMENIKVVNNDKNYGIAKALNQGAKYAIENGYKWLLTLDQDSEFLPGTYEALLVSYDKMFDKDKTMLIAPQFKERIKCGDNDKALPSSENICWKNESLIITSGSLIKTEVFKYIGFFEEKLFIDKVDFDFTLKLNVKGFFSKIAVNVPFIHEFGKELKKYCFTVSNYSPVRRYYIARNSIYILKKYLFSKPKESLYLMLRSGCFFAFIKVLFFENNKFDKIKSIYNGLIDGLLNKY